MSERGRHRAPGRHARPKNRQAPLTAIFVTGVLIFGITAGSKAYSVTPKPAPLALDAPALADTKSSEIDVKQLSPDTKLVTAVEEIPFGTNETADPALAQGTRIVKQPGTAGNAEVKYTVTMLNGVEVSRTEVSRSVNREPIPEVVVAGSGDPKAIAAALKAAESNIDSVAESKAFAEMYIKSTYNWGADQNSCLVDLWERESNWRVLAENRSSGAYGIPQALPGSRMAEIANDWRTNAATQIKWGAAYISDRYETPCAALAKQKARGWY